MSESKTSVKARRPWRDAIAPTERVLMITSIWPVEENNSIFRKLKITFLTIVVIIFDITNIVELRNLLLRQDYEALSIHLSTFGLFIGYTIKITIFLFKKKSFRNMIDIIGLPVFEEYPPELQKYKDKCIFVSNGIATFYISCVAASVFLYLNKPLYTKHPLPISFSYELNWVTYILVLALEWFSCYYLVMIGISFDMLNIGLINIATAQLDILSEMITTFKPKNPEFLDAEEYVFFSKCASRHRDIIRFVDQIENVFSFIFLAQCLASVTSICNGAFQLTHTSEMYSIDFIDNCAFAFDVLFEIGICCWFAGLLTIKSQQVADACYNYNWLNSSTRTRKLLLIILCRSQNPLYITAGKFIRLSMSSFLAVIKTAYSYFALMQSLYDKKNNQFL